MDGQREGRLAHRLEQDHTRGDRKVREVARIEELVVAKRVLAHHVLGVDLHDAVDEPEGWLLGDELEHLRRGQHPSTSVPGAYGGGTRTAPANRP